MIEKRKVVRELQLSISVLYFLLLLIFITDLGFSGKVSKIYSIFIFAKLIECLKWFFSVIAD